MNVRNSLRTLGAKIIDQRPGLRIQVALIAAAKAGVTHQAFQSRWALHPPEVREPQVVRAADARPSPASDHLELRRQPFVQPVGKGIVTRQEAAVSRELMDHLVGRRYPGRSPADRAPVTAFRT